MAVVTHIGDIFQVRLNYVLPPTDRGMNVLYYKLDNVSVPGGGLWAGAPTFEIAPLLAEKVFESIGPEWATFASNRVRMATADAQSISPGPKSRAFVHDPGLGFEGEIVDEALPLQDAVTVLKQTALAGRQYMGRVFVCGFPESAQASGVLVNDTLTLMEAFTNRIAEIQPVLYLGDTLNFYPVLYAVDPGPPIVERTTYIIDAIISDPVMKTMRSRRPGKGS